MSDPATLPPLLILYDGVCGLCNKSIQYLLDWDHAGLYVYAAQQGEVAAALKERHPDAPLLSSVVLVEQTSEGEKIYTHSEAIFRIVARLDAPYRYLSWFGILPGFITDLAYNFVSDIRYRVWGKYDTCRMPSPEERARFLG